VTDEQLGKLIYALAIIHGWAPTDAVRMAKWALRTDPTTGDTARPSPVPEER